MRIGSILAVAVLISEGMQSRPANSPRVEVLHVPYGGIQPEVVVDTAGAIHMVYLVGQPASANIYYVRSRDGGKTFSSAVRVNGQDSSAIATGTVRGAQLAIGRNGRIHVAWNGSD